MDLGLGKEPGVLVEHALAPPEPGEPIVDQRDAHAPQPSVPPSLAGPVAGHGSWPADPVAAPGAASTHP